MPLIYSSGPSAFDYVFNTGGTRDALAFLSFAYSHGKGEFGWQTHRVGEIGGRVVAAGAAFDGRAVLCFTIAGALQILRFYGPIRAWGVMVRGLRTETVIKPPRAHEYYLCHVGVPEERRSQGIGARFCAIYSKASTPIDITARPLMLRSPIRALRLLYERLGFVVEALRASKLQNRHGRVADHYRMSRAARPAAPR